MSTGLIGLLQQDDELLSAEAEQLIGAPEGVFHDLAHEQQHFISEEMAMLVIDRLEVIDVEQAEPARLPRRRDRLGTRVAQLRGELVDAALEGLAIQQPCQCIALPVLQQRQLVLQNSQHPLNECRIARRHRLFGENLEHSRDAPPVLDREDRHVRLIEATGVHQPPGHQTLLPPWMVGHAG